MRITAYLKIADGESDVLVKTGDVEQRLSIAAKPEGNGLGVNGGELLFLAAAACYCNDIYREARTRGVVVDAVEVCVSGEFLNAGAAASSVTYTVKLKGPDPSLLRDLAALTDRVAEVHQSLRIPVPIVLTEVEVAE